MHQVWKHDASNALRNTSRRALLPDPWGSEREERRIQVNHWVQTGWIPQHPFASRRYTSQGPSRVSRHINNSGPDAQAAPSFIPRSRELQVFVDGSCLYNGQKEAVAAIGVWIAPGHHLNRSRVVPLSHRHTNNSAEILAAAEGLIITKMLGCKKVCINSDSQFLVGNWETNIPFWKNNGWKTSKNKKVRNRKEFQELLKCAEGLDVTFRHVKGHANIRGNVEADFLAKTASQRFLEKKRYEEGLFSARKAILEGMVNRE